MAVVKNGDVVTVHYTGKLETGEQFDSSADREPLEFTVGAGMMIAGFDKGVLGMAVAEKKSLLIPSEDAYGQWEEQNVFDFPLSNVPEDMKLEVGMQLTLTNEEGQPLRVIVADIKEDAAIMDANHFLAGKTLQFDVEIVTINGNKPLIIMP